MANVLVEENSLTAIANAIRNKNDSNTTYKPSEMDEAINDLVVINNDRWVRPAAWPDYSQVDISEDEVIYLTYETSMDDGWISIRVFGNYKVERGSLTNGIFTAVDSANCDSGTSFQKPLPTDEGAYVVYKITPQAGAHLERFFFARRDNLKTSLYRHAQQQPCVERYASLPYWTGISGRAGNQYVWTTGFLIADTIMNGTPSGSFQDLYNDSNTILEKIDLSTCSFSEITSLQAAFSTKPILFDISLPNDLSSTCKSLANCFYQNSNLKIIDLTGWDTSGVTTMASMFYECFYLTEIKGIEDFDVSKCTTIASMFRSCFTLQKLDLSNWQTSSSLTSINDLFYTCRGLKELDVSKFNVENVTTVAGAFYGVKQLKALDLSTWRITSKCTNFAGFFAYSNNLENIIIPSTWDTSKVTNFDSCFIDCRRIKALDISSWNFSAATNIKNIFSGCYNLKDISISMDLTKVTTRANVGGLFANCWKLKNLSNITFTNSKFMPGFRYCYSIDNITIPSTVINLGEYCLANLHQCQYIDFSNLSAVPTLGVAADITTEINSQVKIFVPTSLFETWVTTTPWNNGTLVDRTLPYSDFNFYKGIDEDVLSLDLSNIEWTRNYSYSQNSAVGTAYASMVNIGTVANGKRISSGLIDIPANAESIRISTNSGYPFTAFCYDENGNYLKHYTEWNASPYLIHPSTANPAKKIAIVIRRGDGTDFLYSADWAETEISIEYKLAS